MLLDLAFQSGLGNRADDGVYMLSVLEEQDARYRADVESHGRTLIRVDVYLRHLGLAGVLARQLIEERRHDLAGPTPRRPKVHEHQALRLLDFRSERGVAYV